jgi:hypothetical protein
VPREAAAIIDRGASTLSRHRALTHERFAGRGSAA